MAKVTVSKRIDAPVEDVFSSWDDFGNIYRFHPGLSSSHLLSDAAAPTGVGTERQCNLADEKNWVKERVEEYVPNQRIVISVYDTSMPVKTMLATVEFEPISENRSRIRLTAEFEPKMGLLGKLMVPLMKRQFRSLLTQMLESNADYVVSGDVVAAAA